MSKNWTVREVLGWTKDYFRRKAIESARLEAEVLLAHALRVDRLELYLRPERRLARSERLSFKQLIQRRCEGMPLQYLIGEVDFFHCKLKVSPAGLIPRPETEELVDLIIRDLSKNARYSIQILDLGTGTGAIAIALTRALPQAYALAVDISAEALALAGENAKRNGVHDRVHFVRSDWYQNVTGTFDLIVSNPPYVPRDQLQILPTEVQKEPSVALDGGPDGLESLTKIISASGRFLHDQGSLYLEIGVNQGAAVRQIIQRTVAYRQLSVMKDISGNERFVRAQRASLSTSGSRQT
jgi:release factor glutamine methyltransferase